MKRPNDHATLRAGLLGVVLALSGCDGPEAVAPLAAEPGRPPETRLRYPPGLQPVLVAPDGSRRRIESLLNLRRRMAFGDYHWDEAGIAPGPTWVQVDLGRQLISVIRGGHEIGSAIILYGSDGKPTPTGVFPIRAKSRTHRSSLYDADMPFSLWLTGDGVAIHASDVESGRATHGCIGVPPEFAARLFDAVRRGDEVVVLPPRASG